MASVIALNPPAGWLRGLKFDVTYVGGIAALALASGWFVVNNPKLFPAVFVINGWLLGYHHVISTFTRLTFDRDSLQQHKFLVTWLPLIVLVAVAVTCVLLGKWILTTAYLYWQWWHYTRQSYGISRIYQRKAGLPDRQIHKLIIYAVPTLGILYRSYQSPDKFLFLELRVLPVPFWLLLTLAIAVIAIVAWWLTDQLRAKVEGRFSLAHATYITSHLCIFSVGYLLIDDINHGWLVLNVWHNCQYILTVWMFNNSRFKHGVDPAHRFLSQISQRQNVIRYLAVCLVISTAVYSLMSYSLSWLAAVTTTSLPLFAIAFQAANFHHYLVDSVIWKVRRRSVRENLGIAT